jgi:hypothetical protein
MIAARPHRSPQSRRLATRILLILGQDGGRTGADLAQLLGATVADVRSACWRLYHIGRLDWCGRYAVLRPEVPAARRAA